jgi:pilus assembly protein Flp/PilA
MRTQFEIFSTWAKAHAKTDRGAAMVEYALLVALIAIVAIIALQTLGKTVSSEFSEINSGVEN